jgi:hypothetical protein
MSEREKKILAQLASAIPKLDENKQNYILGVAEGMAMVREEKEKKDAKTSDKKG